MSSRQDESPITQATLNKLRSAGYTDLRALRRASLEDVLAVCRLSREELAALEEEMARAGVRLRTAPVRYPFISPLLVREVASVGIDLSRTSVSSIGLPKWAEEPLLAGGLETVLELARASTFYVRTVLGYGGRPQSILRSLVEEHLLSLLRRAREGDDSLRNLRLRPRTVRALWRAGIFTRDQLQRLSAADLSRIPGLGPRAIEEILQALPGRHGTAPEPGDAAVQAEAITLRPERAARPLSELALPRALVRRLEAEGLRTVGDLAAAPPERLERIPRVGVSSVRRIRSALDQYLLHTLEDVGEAAPEHTAYVRAEAASTSLDARLRSLLNGLGDRRLARILALRAGLDGRARTLAEVGRDLGLSRERVRQLERRALDSLRGSRPNEVAALVSPLVDALATAGGVAPVGYVEGQIQTVFVLERVPPAGAAHLLVSLCGEVRQVAGGLCLLTDAAPDEVHQLDQAVESLLRKRLEPIPVAKLGEELARLPAYASILRRFPTFSVAARVRANPTLELTRSGDVALAEWSRTRLDETVRALRSIGRPAHFREVAALVREIVPEGTSVSEQGVHNLLLHEPVFARVARGVFGLAEWQPEDTEIARRVREQLEAAGRPMEVVEIATAVGESRAVVERYLVSRPEFAPIGRTRYALARS